MGVYRIGSGVVWAWLAAALTAGAAAPERLADADFEPRRLAGLRAAAARPLKLGPNPATWVDEERWSVAHARLALNADPAAVAEANRYLAEVEWVSLWHGLVADTDIQVTDLLRTWLEFHESDRLTDAAKRHLRGLFEAWEPPNRDRNQFAERAYRWPAEYTENHSLNILTAAYLCDMILTRDRALRRELVRAFLHDRARWGWSEFHSPSYAIHTAKPLSLLADFAPDPEIRQAAAMLLDLLALDFAAHGLGWFRGLPFARGYGSGVNNRSNSIVELMRHWFGDPDPQARYGGGTALVHLLTSGYRPPAMAARLCRDLAARGSYTLRQTATHGPAKLRVPIVVAVTPEITMASAAGHGHYYDGHYWSVSFASDPRQVITGRYGRGRNLLQVDGVLAVFGEARWHGGLARAVVDGLAAAWFWDEGAGRVVQVEAGPGLNVFILERGLPAAGLADRIRAMEIGFSDGVVSWRMPDGRPVRMVNRMRAGQWALAEAWVAGEWHQPDANVLYDSPYLRSERDSAVVQGRDGREGWRYDLRDPAAPRIERAAAGPFPAWPPARVAGPLGMEFARIPAGEFPAGARADEGRAGDRPFAWQRTAAYYMGRTEVTVAQYRAFLAANPKTARPPDWFFADWGKSDGHAQAQVSWREATAFCAWLTARHPGRYRLPTEDEWEKAARGWSYRVYPWGDDYDGSQAGEPNGQYAVAGARAPDRSPFDVLDMAGNVWEWCADAWPHPDGAAWRLLKGCSWNFDPDTFRIGRRSGLGEEARSPHIGFRVVWEPD